MEVNKKKVDVVWVEYDGIKWYSSKSGYWVGSPERGKIARLHVYVWEKHNGPVPKGFHVHHKDQDKSNNCIDNLELISGADHLSFHGKERRDIAGKNIIEFAVPAAREWHKSEQGREWHKEQYERTLSKKWGEKVEKTCIVCGKKFETSVLMQNKSKFCSNACKSKYRRDMKLDNVEKTCEYCGSTFSSSKYEKQRFCSISCRSKAMKGVKKPRLHHQG